jgi:hypothetical protein
MWSAPSDAGEEGVYAVPFDKALAAAKDAAAEMGFVVREERPQGPDRHQVLSSDSARYVRLSVEKRAADISVRVLVRSKMDTREAVATDTAIARDIHARIAGRLK